MSRSFEQFFNENANVGGVLGGPSTTSAFSGDTYAPGDARVARPTFNKKIKKKRSKRKQVPDFLISRRNLSQTS